MARAFRKEKEKGNPMEAKGYGWRSSYIKGKGKKGKGFKGKGYGKRSWYSTTPGTTSTTSTTGFHGLSAKPGRSLDITDGIPNSNTSVPSAAMSDSGNTAKEYTIHTPTDDDEVIKLGKVTRIRSTSTEESAEDKKPVKDKKHSTAFTFASGFFNIKEYFVVRGQKRQGLIIDPGAPSGSVGSETLRELLRSCVEPFGLQDQVQILRGKTSPVSGISGASNRTLGQVTLPLFAGGHTITFTGEILGGEGSLCPALVGNPALRRMSSVIFANFFENGDGLLTVDMEHDKPNKDNQESMKIKLFRLLLTESGHYLLPTDEASRTEMQKEPNKK